MSALYGLNDPRISISSVCSAEGEGIPIPVGIRMPILLEGIPESGEDDDDMAAYGCGVLEVGIAGVGWRKVVSLGSRRGSGIAS